MSVRLRYRHKNTHEKHVISTVKLKRIKHLSGSNIYQPIINQYFNIIIENPWESPNKGRKRDRERERERESSFGVVLKIC